MAVEYKETEAQQLKQKHPLTCLLYLAGTAALPMLWLHPAVLAESVVLLMLVNVTLDRGRQMKRNGGMLLFLALLFLVLNPLFSHRGRIVLFTLWENPITLEAVVYGGLLAMSLLAVLLAFQAGNIYLDADKWMYLFSRIVQKTTFALLLCMREIPLLRQRARQLHAVHRLKYRREQRNFRQRIAGGARELSALVSWSLEDALQTAQSMRARGYGLYRKRTFYFPYRFRTEDALLCAFFVVTGIVLACLRWSGGLVFSVYPQLEAVAWSGKLAIACLLYGIYIIIPIWLETEEWLQWRCCK